MSVDEIRETKRTLEELDRQAAETDAASEAIKRDADAAREVSRKLREEADRVQRRLAALAG